jgi:cytochrome c oxidase assembly factor CtaG
MVVMAIPGAVLVFEPTVRYAFYLHAARSLHVSALADQHLGGAVMWVGGGLAMFALALTAVMRELAAEERRQRRRDEHAAQMPRAAVAQAAAPRGMAQR